MLNYDVLLVIKNLVHLLLLHLDCLSASVSVGTPSELHSHCAYCLPYRCSATCNYYFQWQVFDAGKSFMIQKVLYSNANGSQNGVAESEDGVGKYGWQVVVNSSDGVKVDDENQ